MECNYDYLYIFDGPSYNSKLLASLTGYDPPGQITSTSHEVISHSVIIFELLIHFLLFGFKALSLFRSPVC